jgi:hypothetical protein
MLTVGQIDATSFKCVKECYEMLHTSQTSAILRTLTSGRSVAVMERNEVFFTRRLLGEKQWVHEMHANAKASKK